MAGPVKGTWGGEDIELNDAATETTLLLLLKAVEKMGKGQGGSGSASTSEETSKAVKQLGDNADISKEQVEELGEASQSTAETMKNAFGTVSKMFTGLAEEFLIGGDRLSDFTSHVTGAMKEIPVIGGVLGGAAQLFVGVIDSQIDTFRQLSSSGVSFGSSLFDAKNAATQAGLSMSTFANTISQNAESLALLGGGAAEGARTFKNVSGIVQKQFGPQFSALGLQMEETAQFTADYLELQTKLGRSQKMSDQQLANGTGNYVKQLDYLAKVTGKQREQIAQELKTATLDKRLKAMMGTMDAGIRENLTSTLSIIESSSPEMADAVKNMVATGGVPVSDFGKSLVRLNPNLGTMAAGLADGSVTQEEYMAEVRKTAQGLEGMSEEQRKTIGLTQALGNTAFDADLALMGMSKAGLNSAEALSDQQKQMNAGNKGLLDFERRITEARNIIFGALIQSGVFQEIEKAFAGVIDYFTSDDGLNSMKEAVDNVAQGIKGFIEDIKEFGLGATLKKYIGDAFGALGGMMGNAFVSMLTNPKVLGAVAAAFLAMKAAKGVGGMMGGAGKAAGGAGSAIGKGAGAGMKGLASGIAAFANPAVAIGAVVFGTAIAAIGAGIAGATFLVGKALPTLAEGMKSFEELDGRALIDTGKGMGAIGLGLAAFGAGSAVSGLGNLVGGIAEGITGLFGGDDPLTKLKKFSEANIDGAAVERNAQALVAFSDAMAKQGAGAGMTGIGGLVSGIAGFFGADTDIPYDEISKFGSYVLPAEAIKRNSEAVVAFGDAMAAFGGGVTQQAVGGLLGGVASFFGSKTKLPINEILLFGAVEFNQETIKKNSEAVKAFGEAMTSVPAVEREKVGGLLGGIGAFFNGEEGGISVLKDVAEFGAVKVANIENVIANAEALKLFGEAMAAAPANVNRDSSGGLLGGVSAFFNGEEGGMTVLSDLNEFGKTKIENVEQIKINAEALKLFGEAMSGLSGVEVAKLDFGNIPKLVTDIESFENMDFDLDKIRENAAIMNGLGNTFNSFGQVSSENLKLFTEGLDTDGIINYNKALNDLIASLEKLNETMGANGETNGEAQTAVQDAIGAAQGAGTGGADKLDQLNTTMQAMLAANVQIANNTKKTVEVTKKNSDNLFG
jgi:hypothetical protein